MSIIGRARKLEEKTRTSILRGARQLEQKIQDRLQGTHIGDEPLEIWRGIAREIEGQIQAVKDGYVFPHRLVTVTICATSGDRKAALAAAFETPRLDEDIRQILRDSECDVPEDLTVRLKFAAESEPEWKNPVFHIKYARPPKRSAEVEPTPAPPHPARMIASLRVALGKTDRPAYKLTRDVTLIGRGENSTCDIVFEDSDDSINRTVSRKHAKIVYEPETQTYVLFDLGSSRGTALVRAGRSSKLPSGSRGRRLQPGDQIVLGKAVLDFS